MSKTRIVLVVGFVLLIVCVIVAVLCQVLSVQTVRSQDHRIIYRHNVSKSDGRANLVNQPGECNIWSTDEHIYGKKDASIGDLPSIAILEYLVGHNTYTFDCVGSLINHRYVITTAQCLTDKQLVNVRLGEYDILASPDCNKFHECHPEPINAGIEKIIIHEDYTKNDHINDIGLIRLSMNVPVQGKFIRPICIAEPMINTPIGQPVEVLGWGSKSEIKHSPILQKIGIFIIDIAKCQQTYAKHKILQSQMCGGTIDMCNSYLGAPLVTKYNHRTYIEGMVSYGYGCGGNDIPTVFTKVNYYYNWILQNLQP